MHDTNKERILKMPFASIYPHYLTKAEKKGRTKEEVDEIINWLTGYNQEQLSETLENQTNFQDFFEKAKINPNALLIKGSICGYKVEEIENPLVQQIRYLDKLIDELAKGKAMEKIFRK